MFFLILVVILLISIAVHEGGHFVALRRYGLTSPIFSVGVGATVFHWTCAWRDGTSTKFKLGLFPIAGFVVIPEMGKEERLLAENP